MRNLEKKREAWRRWYWNNREKVRERARRWAKNNPEKERERCRKWARNNPERMRETWRRWYRNNREKDCERVRRRYWKNPEKARERVRRWARNNREKRREGKRRWDKAHPEAYRTVNAKVSKLIRVCLKRAKAKPKAFRRSEDLLGYTMGALEKNLKRKIPKGYTWRDYIDGKLHLDHKIPISAFNITSADDIAFKECWSLKNLQLLPAIDNLAKQDKIDGHFQPFLPITIPKIPLAKGTQRLQPESQILRCGA